MVDIVDMIETVDIVDIVKAIQQSTSVTLWQKGSADVCE